jgi:hypothetical protein
MNNNNNNNNVFHISGRYALDNEGCAVFDWPCTTVSVVFSGVAAVSVFMDCGGGYFTAQLSKLLESSEHTLTAVCEFCAPASDSGCDLRTYNLFQQLDARRRYLLHIRKRNEPYIATALLRYTPARVKHLILHGTNARLHTNDMTPAVLYGCGPGHGSDRRPHRQIEFVGDSDLMGFGARATRASPADDTWNISGREQDALVSFGSLCAQQLRAEYHCIGWSGKGVHSQSWLSVGTETLADLYTRALATRADTAHWPCRADWHPRLVVLYAGANDFSNQIAYPTVERFAQAYAEFIDKILTYHSARDTRVLCVSLEQWQNLTGHACGSESQRRSAECVARGVCLATQLGAARWGAGRVFAASLRLSRVLNPSADFGSLMHWNRNAHCLVAEALVPHIRRISEWD